MASTTFDFCVLAEERSFLAVNHQEHVANVRSALPDVAVFLDPSSTHLERDRLFDVSENNLTGDRILAPYACMST
jgi:hypothetical protein